MRRLSLIAFCLLFIPIVGRAQAPITNPDYPFGVVGRYTPVKIDVLANDTTLAGTLVKSSVTIVQLPSFGIATVDNVTGLITYVDTSSASADTVETFAYTVRNSLGFTSDTTTVLFFVSNSVDDDAMILKDSTLAINVAANDSVNNDFYPNPATVAVLTGPYHGTINSVVAGVITYTPNSGFAGRDSLVYQDSAASGNGIATIATLRILVDDPPVARPDTATTSRNVPVAINVLANDSDSDGALVPSTVFVEIPPDSGTAVVNPVTGFVTYTPKPGFVGTDRFSYGVLDNVGIPSQLATVVVRVILAVPPVAVNDLVVSLGQNTPGRVSVLANDTAKTGSLRPRTLTVVQAPAHGSTVVDTVGGTILYAPNASYLGPDSLGYTVRNDSNLTSNTAFVAFTVRAQVNDQAVTLQDSAVTVNVVANDSVSSLYIPAPATLAIQTPPAHGSVTGINTIIGSITYQPSPLYLGRDSLVYRVQNGSGVTVAIASLLIRVRQPNLPPIAVNDSRALPENTTVMVGVLANDSDPNGDTLHVLSVTTPFHGTASVVRDSIRYTPNMNYLGRDSCSYVVGDPYGGKDTALVLFNVISVAYDITDLGTLGGTVSRAYGMNDLGTVVGASLTATGQVQAFRWSAGTMTPLSSPDTGATQAFAINRNGWIAGARMQGGIIDPIVWRSDTITSLGSLGASPGIAYAVNDSGAIVGSSASGTLLKAFSWQNGTMTALDPLARTSQAFGVNATGTVAGYVESLPLRPSASTGTVGTGWTFTVSDTALTRAYAVNDSGSFAGSRQMDTTVTAVIWDRTGTGTLLPAGAGGFSEAYSLNNAGLAVGVSGSITFGAAPPASIVRNLHRISSAQDFVALLKDRSLLTRATAGQQNLRAAIWVSGTLIDLNDVIPATGTWTLLEARAINSGSLIVGTGIVGGQAHAFLLTPSASPPPVASRLDVGTTENSAVVFNVLVSAHDPHGEQLTLVTVSGAKKGATRFTPDGVVTYTPFAHALGRDTLQYVVRAGRGAMAQGSVIVSVVTPPAEYALAQNYPNPFNPATTITYALPHAGNVSLTVFNVLGQRVRTLVDETQDVGEHRIVFDAHGLSSGVYFYSLRAGTFSATRRLLLLK